MAQIFVSHASADKPVIDAFFDLLQTGCDLSMDDIFCSSVEGAGIETGAQFVEWISEHLKESEIVILFVTDNYLASKFCLAEMGAAWALGIEVFPLVGPDIPCDVGAIMLGKQTAVPDQTGLDELRDRIGKYIPKAKKNTPRWTIKRNAFQELFQKRYPELPRPELIERAELTKAKELTDEATKLYSERLDENRSLREQIELLKKAKDRQEVAAIEREFSTTEATYSQLLSKVSKLLKGLSPVEVRCIYAYHNDDYWAPAREESELYGSEIEQARDSEWVIEGTDEYDQTTYSPNTDHPRTRPALAAIKELDDFISDQMPREMREQIEEGNKYLVGIRNREYWEKELHWLI